MYVLSGMFVLTELERLVKQIKGDARVRRVGTSRSGSWIVNEYQVEGLSYKKLIKLDNAARRQLKYKLKKKLGTNAVFIRVGIRANNKGQVLIGYKK